MRFKKRERERSSLSNKKIDPSHCQQESSEFKPTPGNDLFSFPRFVKRKCDGAQPPARHISNSDGKCNERMSLTILLYYMRVEA